MMKRVLVLGGTGFVGRHVCEKASRLGCRLTVPTRKPGAGKLLLPLPWVDVEVADVHDEAALTRLVRGHDAVVNLVAILHGTRAQFERAHVALPQQLVQACKAAGVRRIVHVSALGIGPEGGKEAPSNYLRSKTAGEAALRDSGDSGLALTLLRKYGCLLQSVRRHPVCEARLARKKAEAPSRGFQASHLSKIFATMV